MKLRWVLGLLLLPSVFTNKLLHSYLFLVQVVTQNIWLVVYEAELSILTSIRLNKPLTTYILSLTLNPNQAFHCLAKNTTNRSYHMAGTREEKGETRTVGVVVAWVMRDLRCIWLVHRMLHRISNILLLLVLLWLEPAYIDMVL